MKYYNMLNQHGSIATLPIEEFISLLEFKLIALNYAKEQDSLWNYHAEELEKEIDKIKGFVKMMRS